VESDSTAAAALTAQTHGRQTSPDRACFTGILFVLCSGIPWEMLPHHFSLLDWLSRYGEVTGGRGRQFDPGSF
jgi:hypothetical protein